MRLWVVAVSLCVASCSFGADSDERADYVVLYTGQSTSLDGAAARLVARAAIYADKMPSLRIVVAGFADAPGAPEADQIQSRIRAQRVADGLVGDGVGRDRIKLMPRRALGSDPASESRRVEIRLDR